MEIALVIAAVLVASTAQRLTGMGFALVAAPLLIIATGPIVGVMLAILAGGASSLLMLWRVWRDVEWLRALALSASAVVGIVVGAAIAAYSPRPLLQVVIGLVVLVALGISPLLARRRAISGGPVVTASAGIASGVLNATAGLAGPPLTVYAVLSRWPQRAFAATLQPFFIATTVVTLIIKSLFTPDAWPELSLWAWVGLAAALVAGMVIGELLAKRVPDRAARRAVIALAAAGAVATIVDGILSASA